MWRFIQVPATTATPGAGPGKRSPKSPASLAGPHDLQIVLVGSEAEAGLNRRLKEAIGAPIVDLTGLTTVKTLAACLAKCAVFIGNDSGVAHLASAVETASLTIFGPSNATGLVARRKRTLAAGR